MGVHPCIDRLVTGPQIPFVSLSEPQIVQQSEPDSLGYVWAALGQLLLNEQAGAATMDRDARQTAPVALFGNLVLTASVRFGSSSPTRPGSETSASTQEYIEPSQSPLVEDFTLRLASCFVRCVVNYAQPSNKTSPFVHFRDGRLTSTYETGNEDQQIRATDDGGLQLRLGGQIYQMASLEAKRSCGAFDKNGQLTLSDENLGQLLGEALALRRNEGNKKVSPDLITILAVQRRVKFLHFEITPEFLAVYEGLPIAELAHEATYMKVSSTTWFDMNDLRQRKDLVSHILALVAWADERATAIMNAISGI